MNIGARTVGLVGIGLIGNALARRLLGAGFQVVGYDVEGTKRAALEALGGKAAGSVAEVGAACGRILLAVFDTKQVEDAVAGADGLAASDHAGGKIVVSMSTCDPERIRQLGDTVSGRGLVLLECPLSGTSDQVLRGDSVGLVGGDKARVAEIEDLLRAICKRHYFVGALGNGNKAKLAVNLILGLNRAALAEGLVFAERLGLPLDAFLGVAKGSAAYSQIMDVKGDKMIAGDFTPHGKVAQSHKDFALILSSASATGQTLPLASVYAELMQGCIEHGEGERDNAMVIEQIRRLRAP